MNITILAWVEGVRFEFERPERDSYRDFRVTSRAKFCPYCMRLWASLIVVGDPVPSIQGQSCARCGVQSEHSGPLAGSLLDDLASQTIDFDLIRYLPAALQLREFALHIRQETRDDSTAEHPSAEHPQGYVRRGGPGEFIVASWGERSH